MENINGLWICSESTLVRGQFQKERGSCAGIPTAGYIDGPRGRVYVRDNTTVTEMVSSGAQYILVQAHELQDINQQWHIVTIENFSCLDERLDSAGEMACGLY